MRRVGRLQRWVGRIRLRSVNQLLTASLPVLYCLYDARDYRIGWLGSRVVSVLVSGAEGPGFKSQSRRCRATVLRKLFTPIVPLFTKQQSW